MDAAEITAICTGAPAIIGAVTALIIALRSRQTSNAVQRAVIAHITSNGTAHRAPRP
jgi:hypothetical protein